MKINNETTEKLIDLSYLTELSKGNKLFVNEMIGLFLSENPEELKSLELGIAEKNFHNIKMAAHKLRSSIPFVGLDKIIENDVSEIEALAANKSDLKEIEKQFLKIKDICEKAYLELTPI
jgi:HPt (histidine-containing phosphotransfer) domain-containing protein